MKKKSLFVAGIVLTVIAAACCALGGIIVIDTIKALKSNTGEALGALITIPVSILIYAVQAVLCLIAIGLFIGCVKSNVGGIKTAAIVFAAINAAMILLSVVLFIVMANANASNSEAVTAVIARI